jgi:hypothetical protein
MTLYAVELKITNTFSSYLLADSNEDAEQEMKRRAAQLAPDSVVFDASSYRMESCEHCGEEHFGPVCRKPAASVIRPSWERAQL